MAYIARISHFTFSKEGDSLIIRSERDSFEATYDWPDDLDIDDEELASELHERFYLDARDEYDQKT